LRQKIAEQRINELEVARSSVGSLEARLLGMAEFSRLTTDQQAQVSSTCENTRQGLSRQQRIAMIRDQVRRFEDVEYPSLVSQVDLWLRPVETGTKTAPSDNGDSTTTTTSAPLLQPKIVPSRSIVVHFDKALLADEADIDRYLRAVKQEWLKEIQTGKKVQV